MIPSAFVVLDTLPTTPNGKVNRQSLPTPDMVRFQSAGAFVAPRTTAESILAGIWAEVLRLERVGMHDNFFALGGDSILSIQMIARANQAGLRLTSKQLFQQQTIAELATVDGVTPAIQAEQGLVLGPVPCTPIQHWFFEQEIPDPHHWNQAMLLRYGIRWTSLRWSRRYSTCSYTTTCFAPASGGGRRLAAGYCTS